MQEVLVDVLDGLEDLFDADKAEEVTTDRDNDAVSEGESVHVEK